MLTCSFEDGQKASLRHVVIDSLVFKGDEILLVKRIVKLLEGGKWGLIGGFVERDETIEQAAEREVLEETGYKVLGLKLLRVKDDPMRPNEDRQNIAFVYFCTAQEKVGEADSESSEQRWFPFSALPPKEEVAFDHYDDIEFYLRSRR